MITALDFFNAATNGDGEYLIEHDYCITVTPEQVAIILAKLYEEEE